MKSEFVGRGVCAAALGLSLLVAACGGRSETVEGEGGGGAKGDRQPAPALTPSIFQNPPAVVRPKYRWWMPLAFTDDEQLRKELRAMHDAGAGGAEVTPFAVINSVLEEQSSPRTKRPFLEEYGWGTPLWAHKVEVMLQESERLGLTLDMTIGPYWPSVLPTVDDVNDPLVQQQLLFKGSVLTPGQRYNGMVPKPPNAAGGAIPSLVAVVAARCLDPATCVLGAQGATVGAKLDPESVTDLTPLLADGNLEWTVPDAGPMWVLLGFWQAGDNQSLKSFTATTPNPVLDHLSVESAQAAADYHDQHILTPKARELIRRIGGGSIFEDSLELSPTMKWTWSFSRDFEKFRGYPVAKVLPVLGGIGEQGTLPGAFDFPDGLGQRAREDYRQSWSDLYLNNRIGTLQKWLHGHGMTFRAQTYGNAIDIPYVASKVDIPEGESLAFGDIVISANPEWYKLLAAGAHMSGRTVVSMECCAYLGPLYATTATQNLQENYRAHAGGITLQVWHGFPYAELPNSTWPGWDGFAFPLIFAEGWGPRQPTWNHYRAINDHLARLQLVLRQGKPRFDVAVYWRDYGLGLLNGGSGVSNGGTSVLHTDRVIDTTSALGKAGYTWEYLSPAFFSEPDAVFRGGRLFPEHSSYKALIVRNEASMPLETARELLALAQQGLPVVVVGAPPSRTPGYYDAANQDTAVQQAITQLLQLSTVTRVANDGAIPGALEGLGVQPSLEFSAPTGIISIRRRTADTDYYYLFNYSTALAVGTDVPLTGADTDVVVGMEGEGRPYELDAWTGSISPVANYESREGRIQVPVKLKRGDIKVIAISRRALDGVAAPDLHGRSTTAELLYRDGALVARSTASGSHEVTLSDGSTVDADISTVPQPMALDRWQLTMESWEPGDGPSQTRRVPYSMTVTALPGGVLPGWLTLPNLLLASGTGRYSTTVDLGLAWSGGHGAYLDLGTVLDTFAVMVNGQLLPQPSMMDPSRIDVGPYLQPGENRIDVDIATTLGNRVRVTKLTDLYFGTGLYGGVIPQNYGLLGPVRLLPYGEAQVAGPVVRNDSDQQDDQRFGGSMPRELLWIIPLALLAYRRRK